MAGSRSNTKVGFEERLGSELVTNGTMEADSDWDDHNLEGGDTHVRDPADGNGSGPNIGGPYAGTYTRYLDVTTTGEGGKMSAGMSVGLGKKYRLSARIWPVAGTVAIVDNSGKLDFSESTSGTGAWEELTVDVICGSAGTEKIKVESVGGAAEWFTDNVSAKEIRLI